MPKFIWGILILLLPMTLAWAKTDEPPHPIIATNNLDRFTSVATLDFSQVSALGLTSGSGVFGMSVDGQIIVTFANAPDQSPLSTAIVWDVATANIIHTRYIGENPYDRVVSSDGEWLLVGQQDGATLYNLVTDESRQVLSIPGRQVLGVWFGADETIQCGETSASVDEVALVICSDGRPPIELFAGETDFARIGRVPAPLSVTASDDGLVTVWNIQSGERLHQAQTEDIPIFGAINVDGASHAVTSGAYLAWRDPMSTQLAILDLETGQNRVLAPLGGDFIAHLRLSRGADVILGVSPQSQPTQLWAWDTATGVKIDLGAFRTCNRSQPDLARFSPDGSTFVIGCDLGLDVWRIAPEV